MTRHQAHLKDLKKLKACGFTLESDAFYMSGCFGKMAVCPPSQGYLKTGYGCMNERCLKFIKKDGEKLYFKSWKAVGHWIHDHETMMPIVSKPWFF